LFLVFIVVCCFVVFCLLFFEQISEGYLISSLQIELQKKKRILKNCFLDFFKGRVFKKECIYSRSNL